MESFSRDGRSPESQATSIAALDPRFRGGTAEVRADQKRLQQPMAAVVLRQAGYSITTDAVAA